MKRLDKEELITNLGNIFSEANSVMVVHYKGMTVDELNNFREKAYPLGIKFKVIKNSLAARALEGSQNQVLHDFFVGPTAIIWGEDPISCAKIVNDFSKKNSKLTIIGGAYSGIKLLDVEVVKLANLPSFDEIRGGIVGLLTVAATRLAILAEAPAANMVTLTQAYGNKTS